MFEKNNFRLKVLAISLISLLVLSIASMTLMASAQIGVPQPEPTVGYIDVSPRLIGVGQSATVNIFIYPIPTNLGYWGYYDGYRGVTVTFVKPDGSKDTFMPVDATGVYDAGQTESLGAIFFYYEPDMVGNWSVSFTMPDQNLTDVTGTVLMKGCTSKPAYFTVQTDPVLAGLINGYPWGELPNEDTFWSYPINSNNRDWSQISGDWLGSGTTGLTILGSSCRLWQPYGSGPETGHIVWKQPYIMGGLVGGDYGSVSYGPQSTTTNFLINTIVMAGKLFANVPNTNTFECIDLATGKVLYTATGRISSGLHLPGNAYVQSVASPTGNVVLDSSYGNTPAANLFGVSGSTWNYYDPLTGTLLRSIVNASGISSYYLVDGTSLAYVINGTAPNQYLTSWNMTKMASVVPGALVVGAIGTNWPTGVEWSRPLPRSLINQLPQIPGQYASSGVRLSIYGMSSDGSVILVRAAPNEYWGFSATDGRSLWNLTLNYPAQQNQEICLYPTNSFIIFDPTEAAFKCYSLLTGTLQWTSDSFSDSVWATTWTVYMGETSDLENFYAIFPDGTARAYSLQDGHEVWRSEAIPSTEYPNNAVPFVNSVVLVDGKLYVYAGYTAMYTINPLSRFGMVVCIDAATGDIVFTLNGGLRVSSAANGYVICSGDYDGNLYALGKGPTSTTVSAPQYAITADTTVTISGSVLDHSPASSSDTLSAIFANGVPAVSDADMSVFMDYLHMQNATLLNNPPQCTGVPVTLTAVDPNGNTVTIGTATSNYQGNYGLQWTPTIPGQYTIYATFEGSNSYYKSSASTFATVNNAASTPAPTQTVQSTVTNSDLLMYLVIGIAAIIIAIAIVGLLVLRKK